MIHHKERFSACQYYYPSFLFSLTKKERKIKIKYSYKSLYCVIHQDTTFFYYFVYINLIMIVFTYFLTILMFACEKNFGACKNIGGARKKRMSEFKFVYVQKNVMYVKKMLLPKFLNPKDRKNVFSI